MNKLKSVVIRCTAQEFHNIIEPTLRQYWYKSVSDFNDFQPFDCAVMIYEDSTYAIVSETTYTLRPKSYTRLTLSDFQAYHPLLAFFTVHANDVYDAEAIVKDVCPCGVDINEIIVPRHLKDDVAAALFDARVTYVVSDQPCKSKQR